MNPLSITASVIGITTFATMSIVQLHNLMDGLSGAEEQLADIAIKLSNVERPLAVLKQLTDDESISDASKQNLR